MKDLLFYPCIITQGLLTKVFHIQLWDVFPYSPKRRFIWLKTVLRITESQSMMSWKIFIGTVESTSWSCTGHLKNDTVCLRTLSRHLLSSLKLAADSFPGEPGQCPTTLWGKKTSSWLSNRNLFQPASGWFVESWPWSQEWREAVPAPLLPLTERHKKVSPQFILRAE